MKYSDRQSIRKWRVIGVLAGAVGAPVCSFAQTIVAGSTMAMKSMSSPTLSSTGFVGTYLVVPAGGATVNFKINASAGAGGSGNPHLQLVIADTTASFTVNSTSAVDYTTQNITLPAGTYLVRNERDFSGNVNVSRNFTVNNLSVNTVSGSGATFANINNGTTALAAADTYITNFRRGTQAVSVVGPGNLPLLAGARVNAHLARIGFSFGNAVPGLSSTGVNNYLGSTNTTQQINYQSHLNQNFNAIVPENAGKWANNESTRNTVTMGNVDAFLNYAQSHNMAARMHNVIWGQSQPAWATTLLSQAAGGDAASKADLRNGITSRINYYVGTGVAADRANKYQQLDIYNESYHTGLTVPGSYWNVYTPTGIADIYRQVHAIAPNVRLFANEYNIYASGDKWANYYAQNIEAIRNAGLAAGYGDVVGGVGTQYYVNIDAPDYNDPNAAGASNTVHNPARMMQTIGNLSAQGLPISLTEFGVKSGASQATAAQMLGDSLRLSFGSPSMTGFFMWGFQAENTGSNLFAPAAALYTVQTSNWANWTITEAGKKWQDLLGIQDWDGDTSNGWTTPDQDATVDANGNITLTGFYGSYNVGNQSGFSNLNFNKTGNNVATLATPPNWSIWKTGNSGVWSGGANWSGGIPNAPGQTAYFGPAASPTSISVDGVQTTGMLAFNSSIAYILGGAGTITLQGFNGPSGHRAAIYVVAGNHQVDAAVTISDDTTISTQHGTTLTLTHLQPTTASLIKAGTGTVSLNSVRANALSIQGGTLKIMTTSVLSSLELAGALDGWTSQLDITAASVILNYSGASPLATIQNQIKSGSTNNFSGNGIMSSTVAAIDGSNPHKTAIGFGEAGELGLNSFAGESIIGPAILLRYTLKGDANLDQVVNALDFNMLASHFGSTDATWIRGDFNYDGTVDTLDFDAVAINFNNMLPAAQLGALVPEPILSTMLQFACLIVHQRRRNSPSIRPTR